jgi:hypothetical protein
MLTVAVWHVVVGRSPAEPPIADREDGGTRLRLADSQEVVRLRAEIQRLSAQADVHEASADYLVASERRRLDRRTRRSVGAFDGIRRHTDRAAYLTLLRAERLLKENGDVPGARKAYGQVIEMFPGTSWAQLARQRQSILRKKAGDTL